MAITNTHTEMFAGRIVSESLELVFNRLRQVGVLYHRILSLFIGEIRIKIGDIKD